MSDRIKYIKAIFDDIGRIVRIYKSVHFSGEGAPRDVEVEAGEMLQIFGTSNAIGVAAVSELEASTRQAEAAQAHAEDTLARKADALAVVEETNARMEAALMEATAARAAAEEDAARKAAHIAALEADTARLQAEVVALTPQLESLS